MLRIDDILARKRDILVFGRMIYKAFALIYFLFIAKTIAYLLFVGRTHRITQVTGKTVCVTSIKRGVILF